jgi:heat shock protein HslJ
MKVFRFFLLFALPAVLACNSSSTIPSEQMDPQLQLHDIWALEWMKDQEVTERQFTRGVPVLEIFVVDGRVQGHNGCNQIQGPLQISKEALQFGPLISTRMACNDDGFEQAFMKNLEGPLAYELAEGKLTLSKSGRPLLRFKKVD